MQQTTITTKIIAVQTRILEDAADTEDNMVNTIKPIVLYMYYRLLSYYFHHAKKDPHQRVLYSLWYAIKRF